MQLTKEIKAALKAGKLSEEEAQEKRGDEDGAREVKSTQRRYDHAIPKTKEAHQAGHLFEKPINLRREFFAKERRADDGEGKDQ